MNKKVIRKMESMVIWNIWFILNEENYSRLFGNLHSLKIVSPPEVRAEAAIKLRATLSYYGFGISSGPK